MLTTAAVIARIFSNSVANLFQKKASENNSPILVNLCAYFFMSLFCLIPACFVDWTHYNLHFWFNVILAGILCTVGTIALIEALKIGDLSVLAPINSYKSIIGLISAFVLLGEIPCLKDIFCVVFIVIGSYFVLDTGTESFSVKTFFRRDIRLRIFALLCSGTEAAILKKIILLSSYKISLILWCFSGFICSCLIYLIYYRNFNISPGKKCIKQCIIIALMLFVMQLTTNYVFLKMEVASALSLFQLSSLVSVYLGYKVYREKDIIKKVFGTIIMILSGAVLLLG